MLERIIGVVEAGEMWGLSPDHVKKLCRDGVVRSKKIGKTWVVDKEQSNPKGGNKMIKFDDLNERNSTLFTWNGEKIGGQPIMLGTVQDPYPCDWAEMGVPSFYEAVAIDVFDNEYKVKWEVLDPEIDDESEICDWDNPISVKKI